MKRILKITTFLSLALIAIIFFIFNQLKELPVQKEILKSVYLYPQREDDTLIISVLLDETNIEFNKTAFLLKDRRKNEELTFNFDLKEPRLFRFYSFEPSSVPFIVYITPGDTLKYRLENTEITFEGTNEAHYNFFKELRSLKLVYPKYKEEAGITVFKKSWNDCYHNKLQFLEHYVQVKDIAESFHNKIKGVLEFEYFNGILNRNIIPKGAITNYSEYLKGISIEKFNRNDQDDNLYFYLALTNYLYVVADEKFADVYSEEALEYQLKIIDENLNGKVKEYAITKMLAQFDSNLNTENVSYLQDKIKSYLTQIEDDRYRVVLKAINERLHKLNKRLITEVYAAKLIDQNGNEIILREILQKQGDKIKIIDFWASWCAPCIKGIKTSHQYRENLIQHKKVEFLYFSIDENKENWKKRVTELKEFGMVKNQYLIPDSKNSVLRTYFNVSSIPHYAILDSANNVFLTNAPPPGDTLQFNDIVKKLETVN